MYISRQIFRDAHRIGMPTMQGFWVSLDDVESGVVLIVVSLNVRKNIESILDQHGLLEFFLAIYDRNDIWRIDVLTKQTFMKLIMDAYDVNASHCVLVDDQSSNLENAPCRVIEIKGPGGMCKQHDSELRQIFMEATNSL